MKKYIVCTNIWGKKEVTMWLSRDVFSEEKEYFDTLEEARDFAWLFKEYAMLYPNPEQKKQEYWKNKNKFQSWMYKDIPKIAYETFKPGERLWGYVIGDTEECKVIEWGGLCMMNIHKESDPRRVKDYLFRSADEIPNGYEWDEGEYEGWLQYRWGDGKNAIGYVEPEKPKKKKIEDIAIDKSDEYEKIYEQMEEERKWREEHPDEYNAQLDEAIRKYEEIENNFLKEEDIEKLKRLSDRW